MDSFFIALVRDAKRYARGEFGIEEFRHRTLARLEVANTQELDYFADRLATVRLRKAVRHD